MSFEAMWMLAGALLAVVPYYRWVLLIDGLRLRDVDVIFYPVLVAAFWPICLTLALAYRFYAGRFTPRYEDARRYWTDVRESAKRRARAV